MAGEKVEIEGTAKQIEEGLGSKSSGKASKKDLHVKEVSEHEHEGGMSRKYGAVSVGMGGFHPGEPVYILRAADATALRQIARHKNDLETVEDPKKRPPDQFLTDVEEVIRDFAQWAADNRELVKMPD